jgi:uncharacterized protein YjdB
MSNNVGVRYQSYVTGKGKLPYVEDGVESGTTGQNPGIESLSINFENPDGDMRIAYHAHIKNVGWTPSWEYNGTEIGSGGQGNTIEAIKINITK